MMCVWEGSSHQSQPRFGLPCFDYKFWRYVLGLFCTISFSRLTTTDGHPSSPHPHPLAMSRVCPTLPLSHIIASDAPLLSPISPNEADQYQMYSPVLVDNYAFYQYGLPPSPPNSAGSTGTNSPVPSNRMLRMRMSPDSMSENDQLCLPTHQVFDFPELLNPPSPESPSPSPQMQRRSISVSSAAPSKRELSPVPSITKKPRSAPERVTTKDFIPPDVSGLSKREARLVKNRAAAFLSRQRKREEFETMEVYVNFSPSVSVVKKLNIYAAELLSSSKKTRLFALLPKREALLLRRLLRLLSLRTCSLRSSNFVLS